MMYYSQDIVKNLGNAMLVNDKWLSNDIVLDEVAKMVVFKPSALKIAILDAGISLGEKASDKYIASVISKNISTNPKLKDNLSNLILKYNEVDDSKSYVNFIDAKDTFGRSSKRKIDVKGDKIIKEAISRSFSGTEDESGNVEVKLIDKINIHKNSYDLFSGNEKAKVKKAIIITSAVSVLLTVGAVLLIRYLIKKKKEDSALDLLEDGGEIDDGAEMPPQNQLDPNAIYDPSYMQNNANGGGFQ